MRAGGWFRRHGLVAGLSAGLVVMVCVVIKLGMDLNAQTAYELPGTYMTAPGSPGGDSEYLVLEDGGRFYLYRQFEMLDQGSYTGGDQQIYRLSGETGREYTAVCGSQGVYLVRGDESVVRYFERTSHTPTFINVHP